jgi:hypothetical protein
MSKKNKMIMLFLFIFIIGIVVGVTECQFLYPHFYGTRAPAIGGKSHYENNNNDEFLSEFIENN